MHQESEKKGTNNVGQCIYVKTVRHFNSLHFLKKNRLQISSIYMFETLLQKQYQNKLGFSFKLSEML